MTSSPNPSTLGQPVTFTIGVAPNPPVDTAGGALPPSGNVQFVDITNAKNTVLGTKTLATGSAALAVGNLPGGTRTIVGTYLGDQNYEPRVIGHLARWWAGPP
ncbi:MAG: Ig-like domain-containing protein [Acidimicrobiales bacterium]